MFSAGPVAADGAEMFGPAEGVVRGVGRAPGVLLLRRIWTEEAGVSERERARTIGAWRTELPRGQQGGGVRFHVQRGLGSHRSH